MKSECYNFPKHKLVPRDVLRYSVSTEFDMSYKLIIIISDLLTLPKEEKKEIFTLFLCAS